MDTRAGAASTVRVGVPVEEGVEVAEVDGVGDGGGVGSDDGVRGGVADGEAVTRDTPRANTGMPSAHRAPLPPAPASQLPPPPLPPPPPTSGEAGMAAASIAESTSGLGTSCVTFAYSTQPRRYESECV